ncbi:hypothetical protein VTN00DRAFT_3673 [Thermoascus crustaceus]|uniref:uncharacterized protein n=1 Tax=Thermoascus crustaceus TaxID=5088 RepID=UPI0037440E2A
MSSTDSDLQTFSRPLRVENETLYRLARCLSLTCRKLASCSSEQFFPTAITRLPTGRETGHYLAVYLGLSYLRVAFIDLLRDRQVERHTYVRRTLEKAWPIEEHLRRDQAPALFAWIGDCIAEVVADSLTTSREDASTELTAGISFCFPLKQESVDEAILMPTGKGFALTSALNLQTLVSTEWTLRGATAPLQELGVVTKWDTELDVNSKRPGFQPLEYMVGGRYIGELVRIICYDWFHGALGILRPALPLKLVEEYSLTTEFLSLVVASSYSDEQLARDLSKQLPPPSSGNWSWTPESAGNIRAIASAVQARSAALVAAATVGLLACTREIELQNPECLESSSPWDSDDAPQTTKQEHKLPDVVSSIPGWLNGPEELVVAVSGGVIQHYPNYKESTQRHIDHLLIRAGPQDGGKSVFLREASDGGIVGVGV